MSVPTDRDVLHALEVLSVTIGTIMEDASMIAAGPPAVGSGYADVGETLRKAGEDAARLASAMVILAARGR